MHPAAPATTASTLAPILAAAAVLFAGGIFGFFYAWICSTMWGLDAADPRVAIAAMQAMNASVRNAVFAPIFFGTPVVLFLAAAVARAAGHRRPSLLLAAGGVVYFAGGLMLTTIVNVPMNEALAQVAPPADRAEAAAIWEAYSGRWQVFNVIRTGFSGVALMLAAAALYDLGHGRVGGQ